MNNIDFTDAGYQAAAIANRVGKVGLKTAHMEAVEDEQETEFLEMIENEPSSTSDTR